MKVAVITGGAGGFGREIAAAFYGCGYAVAINYFRSENEALELVGSLGERAMAVRADVCGSGDVSRMAREVHDRWGRMDVLVNNAGTAKDSLLARQREDEWDAVIGTNLRGAFNAIRAFAPLMTEGGHIINISSYSGLKGKEGQAAYSASKAALLGLTKGAALEMAELKIKVNAVLPGYMSAGMGIKSEAAMKKAREDSLLNVLSSPEEAARFVVYLAGTTNITGQIFCLDSRII